MTVQLQLLSADWPQEILDLPDGQEIMGPDLSPDDPLDLQDEEGDLKRPQVLLYRGLSVRMGIHCGEPVCEVDPITQRMVWNRHFFDVIFRSCATRLFYFQDYLGPMVNKTSRVSSNAEGGQILVSMDVEAIYKKYKDESNVARSSNVKQLDPLFVSAGERKLKGFDHAEELISLWPRFRCWI